MLNFPNTTVSVNVRKVGFKFIDLIILASCIYFLALIIKKSDNKRKKIRKNKKIKNNNLRINQANMTAHTLEKTKKSVILKNRNVQNYISEEHCG